MSSEGLRHSLPQVAECAHWRHDGNSLYYSAGEAVMKVVFDPVTGNGGHTTLGVSLAAAHRSFQRQPRPDRIYAQVRTQYIKLQCRRCHVNTKQMVPTKASATTVSPIRVHSQRVESCHERIAL